RPGNRGLLALHRRAEDISRSRFYSEGWIAATWKGWEHPGRFLWQFFLPSRLLSISRGRRLKIFTTERTENTEIKYLKKKYLNANKTSFLNCKLKLPVFFLTRKNLCVLC